MNGKKNRNIIVEEGKWKDFKLVTKANESDASKEVRKFIDRYLAENEELLNKLKKQ